MSTTVQKGIVTDNNLIAFCGLYCGACRSYLKGKCPGCRDNSKATWCKVRSCCIEHDFKSCADCDAIGLEDCKKYNNFMSRAFGFIFNSDRSACINRIKEIGYIDFAAEMAHEKKQTIRRK
jgi:hypothetical protein